MTACFQDVTAHTQQNSASTNYQDLVNASQMDRTSLGTLDIASYFTGTGSETVATADDTIVNDFFNDDDADFVVAAASAPEENLAAMLDDDMDHIFNDV